MKQVNITGVGDLTQLRLIEAPEPRLGSGQVLIDVEAAGVIFADILVRRGTAVIMPGFPYAPGREVVGRIAAAGPESGPWKIGDRVLAMLLGGGYADRVVAAVAPYALPSGNSSGRVLFRVGEDVPAGQAISHGMNLRMAHLMLHGRARPRAGQKILIHSAAGGVGTHLVRLAKAHGLEVFGLVGTSEKAEYCRSNGVDHVINHRTSDYVQEIRNLTDGKGVDVSINMVNGSTLARDAEALAYEGQLLIAGVAAGIGSIEPSRHAKSLTYKHFTSYWHLGKPEDEDALALVEREILQPSAADRIVSFPLAAVAEAHALLESGRSYGKIILEP